MPPPSHNASTSRTAALSSPSLFPSTTSQQQMAYAYMAALVVMMLVALYRMESIQNKILQSSRLRFDPLLSSAEVTATTGDLDWHTMSFVSGSDRGGMVIPKLRSQQQQQQQQQGRNRTKAGAGGGGGVAETAATAASAAAERERFLKLTSQSGFERDGTVFGSCLKIMDDNHWLVEWLAYHWFVLPLRHLVVMIDPKSQTSPVPILERWSSRGLLDVEYVNETYEGTRAREIAGTSPGNKEHLGPQRKFLADCFRSYKQRGWKSWIVATDTDEFIGIHPRVRGYVRSPEDPTYGELYREPSYVQNIPQIDAPGSVMTLLQMELQRRQKLNLEVPYPDCIAMNRMQICTDEVVPSKRTNQEFDDTTATATHVATPSEFRAGDFLTQRFVLGGEQLRPKDMVHVGSLDGAYLRGLDLASARGANTHNVLPGRCPQGAPRRKSVFEAYHYDGSEEQRRFRRDPRGRYGKRMGTLPRVPGTCPKFVADDLKPWLQGFVRLVGVDVAKQLLDGNGRVDGWPPYRQSSSSQQQPQPQPQRVDTS